MEINCENWCNIFRYHGKDACEDDRCPNAELRDSMRSENDGQHK